MRCAKVLGLLFILSFTFVPPVSTQDEVIVFVGFPKVKMVADGVKNGALEKVPEEKVIEFSCVITKRGDKYYWKSRDNHEVTKIRGGAYTTFQRLDRSDYVRIADPSLKKSGVADLLVRGEGLMAFDYVEHLVINLASVNYWGELGHADPVIWKYQP